MADESKEPKDQDSARKRRHLEKRAEFDSLRGRLYERNVTPRRNQRTVLTADDTKTPPHAWGQPSQPNSEPETTSAEMDAVVDPEQVPGVHFDQTAMPKRRTYRSVILIFGLLFFVVAAGISSVYMFFGGNTISGDNISVVLSGPESVGGGEVIPLQIEVTNDNSTQIKAATLIVRYPLGTQSSENEGREVQREVIPLENIDAGETLTIPVKAVVFGEENEEKLINAEVEYQVQGSNGIFVREAEPHRFVINSSPVNITIESLAQVSSGQPIDILFIVRSNSTAVLHDLVVRAEYPFGFDYSSAKPEPVSGQNVWVIDELQPSESVTIVARGVVTGLPTDERSVSAAIGVANDSNAFRLASVFSSASFEYEFEREFIDLSVSVNNSSDETVVVDEGESVEVSLTFTNPLDDTLYDPVVSVELSGTAFDESGVNTSGGFYDSIANTVFFDRNTTNQLEQILPGDSVTLSFSLRPDAFVRQTPDISLLVNAQAKRIQENNVPESLVGSESRTVKFASQAQLLSSVTPQSGLIPPVAEKLTQYTISMRVESGSNDLTNAEVSASLPVYVSWLNITSGDGEITFRPNSRTVVWDVGDIDDNNAATASFAVGFLPSISQVGSVPTLLSSQNLKATDRFTGTVIRDTVSALTTALSSEAGFDSRAGQVRRTEDENDE